MNPVAQTFFISSEYPFGIFLSDIDLFFSKIPDETNRSVKVHIATVENGIPTRTIVPDSTVVKRAADIQSTYKQRSLVDTKFQFQPSDILPTKFTFLKPIFLESGNEYAVIISSESSDFSVFTSEFGQLDLITGKPVTKNPSFGTFLRSENGRSWKVFPYEDLKIQMNKAVFNNSNKNFDLTTIQTNDLNSFNFCAFSSNVSTFKPQKTDVINDITFNYQSGGTSQTNFFGALENDETIELETPITNINSINLQSKLSSGNRDVTSEVNLEHVSITGIENQINNDNTGEDQIEGGNALSKYITKIIQLDNPADELRVILDVNIPFSGSLIEVYVKRRPSVLSKEEVSIRDNVKWQKMATLSAETQIRTNDNLPVSDNETDYTEVEWIWPSPDPNERNYELSYFVSTPNGGTEQIIFNERPKPDPVPSEDQDVNFWNRILFDEFQVKIVFLSSNSAKVPKVRNLRAIASI